MIAADKPRADLVALLLQFEASAGSLASLHLTGPDAVPAVEAWVEMRGHVVEPQTLDRRDLDGRTIEWTMWTITPRSGPDWSVTCSLPDREPAAQADQQVLARVKAALDGEQPAANCCGRCGSAMITTSTGERCLAECDPACARPRVLVGLRSAHHDQDERKEQPEAAEGSV